MAFFGTEIRLCAIDQSEFIGLSSGCRLNEVLITSIHNTSTVRGMVPQMPAVNFTTWGDHTLLCTVIYSEKQKRFISVMKNLVLRVWTMVEAITCKGQKVPVPYEVHSLLNLCDADPLIVFKNGAICQLDASNVLRYLVEPTNDRISLVSVRLMNNNISIAYILENQKGLQCHYICFMNVESTQIVKKFVNFLPNEMSTPKGLCLPDSVNNEVEIVLLDNQGQLVSGTSDVSSMCINWKMYCKVEILADETFITMLSHKDHLVVAKQSSPGVVHCVAFSLKYKVQTHQISMSTTNRTEKVQLFEACGRLFLVTGADLFYIPFSSNNAGLSHFVGCKINNETNDTTPRINEKKCWTSAGLKMQEKCNNGKEIMEQSQNVSEEFLDLLVNRLKESETSDHVICTQILPELIEKKKFTVIGELLSYCEIIPEAVLVDILSAYISHEDSHIHSSSFYKNKNSHKLASHSLIEQIISIQINNSFLLEQLRRLPVDQALFLLRYLHWLLKDVHFLKEKSWTRIIQWVVWISLLLDAHFHNVIILKNERLFAFLREMMSTVARQYEFLENLSAVQELLWITKQKSVDVDTRPKTNYCIESLEFNDNV